MHTVLVLFVAALAPGESEVSNLRPLQAPAPPQCSLPARIARKAVRKQKDHPITQRVKNCPCSPACTCGCNQGLPCRCNPPRQAGPVAHPPGGLGPVRGVLGAPGPAYFGGGGFGGFGGGGGGMRGCAGGG